MSRGEIAVEREDDDWETVLEWKETNFIEYRLQQTPRQNTDHTKIRLQEKGATDWETIDGWIAMEGPQ